MAGNDCERCAPLRQNFKIGLPADLRQAIRIAHENIADGTLVEVASDSLLGSEPFSAIKANGPWDDIIGYRFRCTSCDQLFSLSAETYHGRGGQWRPISK